MIYVINLMLIGAIAMISMYLILSKDKKNLK